MPTTQEAPTALALERQSPAFLGGMAVLAALTSRGGAPFAYNRDAALARGTALLRPRHHGPVLGIRAFKVHLVVFQSVMLKILLSRFRESSTSDSCPHCGPSQSNPQHVLCRDKALGIQPSQISA